MATKTASLEDLLTLAGLQGKRASKRYFLIKLLSTLPSGLSNKRFRLWFASLTQSNLIRWGYLPFVFSVNFSLHSPPIPICPTSMLGTVESCHIQSSSWSS